MIQFILTGAACGVVGFVIGTFVGYMGGVVDVVEVGHAVRHRES